MAQDVQNKVRVSGVAGFLFTVFIILAAVGTPLLAIWGVNVYWVVVFAVVMTLIGIYLLLAIKIADQWEKAIILRFGKFRGLSGPGLFWIVPIVDTIPEWIDHRVMVTPFSAEKTLTKDTVPVDVDAVLFWMVWDAEKAALEVESYRTAIAWAAQTALREVIGQMDLAELPHAPKDQPSNSRALPRHAKHESGVWGFPCGVDQQLPRHPQVHSKKQVCVEPYYKELEVGSIVRIEGYEPISAEVRPEYG